MTQELATRLTDGIHVCLIWHRDEDRVVVTVDDAKTGDSFALDVGRDENAMDVFRHPYAYVAWHGVPTRLAVLSPAGWT